MGCEARCGRCAGWHMLAAAGPLARGPPGRQTKVHAVISAGTTHFKDRRRVAP